MTPTTPGTAAQHPSTTVYELDNGMKVVIREDHFAPVAALQVWVKAGGADEEDIEAGVAHVHEHMLFKGTANRGVGEVAAEIEGSGGRINAWTSWNETVYHIVVASRFADTGLDVLADAVRNSSFDPEELDKELDVVMEEWKRGEDSPSRRIFHSLFGTAYTEHPYQRPVIGTKESIEGLTRERILSFYGRYYAPNNMTVVVVGDIDTRDMKKRIDKAFGDYAKHEIDRPVRPVEPPQDGLRLETIRMQVQESHLALGFHVPGADHPDAPLLDLLAFVIGGGESSRLYTRLVADEQLVTGIGAFAYTPPDPGMFVITSSLESGEMRQAYDAVIEELGKVVSHGVTPDELARARVNLESDFVFRRETVQGQARELGYAVTVHDDPDYDRVYLARLRAATPAALERVARQYLQRDNLTVVTLLPEEARDLLNNDRAMAGASPLAETRGIDKAHSATRVEQIKTVAQTTEGSGSHGTGTSEPKLIRLDNGVRIIVREHHEVPVFAVHAAMLGGILAETPQDNGISSFTAEMLTRGTKKRSREQLARDIESIAASVGGFSGHNSLGVSGTFLSDHLEEGLDLFIEVLRQPAFDPDEVEKARRETLLAIKNREDSSSRVAFDLTYATIYAGHPYGMTTLGETESIKNLSAAGLRKFYERALDPTHLVISVVGDIDAATVARKFGTTLIDLEERSDGFKLPAPAPNPTGVQIKTRETERHQSHIVVGYPSVTVSDSDRYPLAVLNNILSGQGGRLFGELRDKQSLAYSVTAFFTKGLARGLFGGYIATDPANTERAISGLLAEFDQVRTADVDKDELKRSQRYLIGTREISLQTNSALAEDMCFNELYGLGYLAGREYPEKIDAVRRSDVRKVAERYLDPDIRAEIIVGPESAIEAAAGG
ncbi:MAG: pitrilysin family protein [Candidatus Binatia bacterium]